MNKITRRRMLIGLPGIAAGVVATVPAHAAEGKPAQGVPLVLGPFAIDSWFLKTVKESPLGGPLEPLSTPKHDDVVKVLKGCNLYVLDRRVGQAGKDSRFADGYPKAVVEGNLARGVEGW